MSRDKLYTARPHSHKKQVRRLKTRLSGSCLSPGCTSVLFCFDQLESHLIDAWLVVLQVLVVYWGRSEGNTLLAFLSLIFQSQLWHRLPFVPDWQNNHLREMNYEQIASPPVGSRHLSLLPDDWSALWWCPQTLVIFEVAKCGVISFNQETSLSVIF